MSEKLCWKCIADWKIAYPSDRIPIRLMHCHHEEKTKPPCWCDLTSITRSVDSWAPGGWQSWIAKLCPVCGRKLED